MTVFITGAQGVSQPVAQADAQGAGQSFFLQRRANRPLRSWAQPALQVAAGAAQGTCTATQIVSQTVRFSLDLTWVISQTLAFSLVATMVLTMYL